MKFQYLLILLLSSISLLVTAQDSTNTAIIDSTELTLDQLSKMKSTYISTAMEKAVNQGISAASKKALPLRKSPSIISVISEEEIEKSGARELMDVLRLVPGVDFNVDVQGVVGISIRGLWANEGKVLLLLDGQEINETGYATLWFGNNYNISQIKKIELIRGPGSAIYGGYAEYAVINIISKNGEDLNGFNVNVLAGTTNNTYARQNLSFAVGDKINDFTYSVNALVGRGQRSGDNYLDVDSNKSNMAGTSDLNPTNVNAAIAYKNLSARFIYDQLKSQSVDGLGATLSKAYPLNFTNYFGEIKYSVKIGKNFEFQPRFNFKRTTPWEASGPLAVADSTYFEYKMTADRFRLNLVGLWDVSTAINVTFGGEGFYDKAEKNIGVFRNDNVTNVSYSNIAPFAQVLIKTRIANLTVGGRYDYNSSFGGAFNPRLGITKKLGPVNFKLLYASSYRAPSIENIQTSLNNKISPEVTTTFEFETGFQINKEMFVSSSIYDISTKNSIRYFVNPTPTSSSDIDGYTNTGKSGSQGLELDYKYKSEKGLLNFTYAYYTVGYKSIDESNLVILNRNSSLGIANHKFTVLSSINVGKYLYVSPSVNFIGTRYGYVSENVLKTYDPFTQLNLYIGCKNLIQGFTIGVGCFNILNQQNVYLQAYNGLHAQYPGIAREFTIKMSYTFNHK